MKGSIWSAACLAGLAACVAAEGGGPQPTLMETAALSEEARGYRADLLELAANIEAEHPRPWRFILEEDFDALVAKEVASVTSATTKPEFLWSFSRILTSIQCGHSGLFYFNQEDALIAPEDRFPVDVRWHDGGLYVLDPLANAGKVARGDRIREINGRKVSDILKEAGQHIKHEGVSPVSRWAPFNVYATSYITYAVGFPDDWSIRIDGKRKAIDLDPLSEFRHKPIIHPKDPCQERLCYRVDEATNTGIMTIRTFAFYGEEGQAFADYVDGAFADLAANERAGVILDIRGHDGGTGNAGAYILRRLAKEPFAYFAETSDPRGPEGLFQMQEPVDVGFDAPVTLLVDANTVSAAPHFASIFKEHGMGTIVGEPMGGNKSTNDGKRRIFSTENEVEYYVARMRFDVAAPSLPMDAPVMPDKELSYALGDRLDGEDSMMASLLKSIAAERE